MAKSSNMSIFLSFALVLALLIINGAESRLTIHGVRHNVVKPSSTLSCESVVGVQTGDTCTSIAKANGLSRDGFLAFNPNINCDALFVAQWVCIED